MRRILLIFFLLPAGCEYRVPSEPETLRWHLGAEPDTLNPVTSTDAYASRIGSYLYDTLIERENETLDWKPEMAEGWEISPDKLQFTFRLRPGLAWHDGTPVTVDDILYSFERIMDPKVDSPHLKVYYQEIEKVEKVGERSVRFTYKRPYFMAFEFCGTIPIVPRHLFEKGEEFNRHPEGRAPTGNGPYRFVGWETGSRIVVERNDQYWGARPAIKRIRFEVIAEDTIALQVLKKGGLDFAGLRPIQWVRQTDSARFRNRFEKYKFTTPGYSFIGWNRRRPVFADRQVRRAMTMLVNRGEILEKLNFGLGRIVTGPFYVESGAYDGAVAPLAYRPEEAVRLLEEAGWKDRDGDGIRDRDGVPFHFQFLIPSGRRFAERLSTILKEDLARAGIEMEIVRLEWALFVKKLDDRSFDAVTLGWVFGFEQDPYQVWHSSQVDRGSNFVGFADPEVDRLIELGRQEFDRDRRHALYRRIHRIIDEDQPYTFLYSNPHLVALHRRFQNVKIYPIGMDTLEWTVEPRLTADPQGGAL